MDTDTTISISPAQHPWDTFYVKHAFLTPGSKKIIISFMSTDSIFFKDTAIIKIIGLKATVSSSFNDTTLNVGDSLVLSVTAGGTEPVTYQWHRDTAAIAGATNAKLKIDSLTVSSSGDYYCIVKNEWGPAINSDTASVTVIQPNRKPAFEAHAPDTFYATDDTAELAITLSVTDPDSGDSVVFSINGTHLPQGATADMNDNKITLTFAPNTHGRFSFFAKASDGKATDSIAVAVKVTDRTPPIAPVVQIKTPTNNNRPSWTWASGGQGSGSYQYKLDSDELASGATKTTALSFSPVASLSEGVHTLFVQEQDSSGNWSASGKAEVRIDLTPPAAPAVTGTSPTNEQKPAWTWTTSGGIERYRWKLDNNSFQGDSTDSAAASFTPASNLAEGSHTLYVQERDSAENWSASGQFTIKIDLTGPLAPTVSVATPPSNPKPTWTWTSNGGGKGAYRYKLDSQDLSTGSSQTVASTYTPILDLSEGSHTLYVQESDSAGNWSASGSASITIDITPPSPPVVSSQTPTNSQTPTWTWTSAGGGNGTFRYKLDSDDLSSGATQTTQKTHTSSTNLAEGRHTLYVQERDSSGNWSEPGSFATIIDLTPPAPPKVDGPALTNQKTPAFALTTGGGAGGYRYKFDSNDFSSGAVACAGPALTPASQLSEGNHTLYVQERDPAGNWSASDSFKTVTDYTSPLSPSVLGAALTNNLRPTWSWSSGGGGDGMFRYKMGSNDFSTGATDTAGTNFAPNANLAAGTYTLYVIERDAAGNWSTPGSFATIIDPSAPGVPVVTGTASPTNNQKPTWNWASAGGTGNFRYKMDDAALSSGATATTATTFTPAENLTQGSHTLYIEEVNGAGTWSASGLYTIMVDITPPTAPVITAVSPTNNQTPTWSWTSGGNGGNGNFKYKFNSSDLTTGATETNLTSYTPALPLAAGVNTLYIQERDAAGNWSATASKSIVVDLTPPSPPAVSGVSPTNNLKPTWSWTMGAGGDGYYRYKLDDSTLATITTPVGGTSYTPTANLTEGAHTLYIQERDSAGNWSVRVSFAITVDISSGNAPAVFGDSLTTNPRPTWTWISGGGAGAYRYKLDSPTMADATETSAASYTPLANLPDGTHILYVQEKDAAQNWSASGFFSITIDATPPGQPSITVASPTSTLKPVFTLTQGNPSGNGTFRCRLDNPNLTSGTITVTATGNTAYFTPAANLSEAQHTLYAQERDAAGNWSQTGQVSVFELPFAPTAFTATGQSETQIHLAWTDNSSIETGYEIQRSTDNANFAALTTTDSNATSYNDANLPHAKRYYYRVRAVSAGGNSAWSSSVSAYTYAVLTTTVSPAGAGTVSPTAGTHAYPYGTTVPLTATPASCKLFDSWGGHIYSNTTSYTLTSDFTATAYFIDEPAPAAPVMNINCVLSGGYPATISITCSTPGAQIYYNKAEYGTSVSDPTAASTRYTGPFTINTFCQAGPARIKAIAYGCGRYSSVVLKTICYCQEQ
jgi:hypothetical protein